jgi:hypothetical protein
MSEDNGITTQKHYKCPNATVLLSAAFICVRLLKFCQTEMFQNREIFFYYDVAAFTCIFYNKRAILKRLCATRFVLLRLIVKEILRSRRHNIC